MLWFGILLVNTLNFSTKNTHFWVLSVDDYKPNSVS